jgi:hypothetical protein
VALLGRSSFRSQRIVGTLIMAHRHTAYNDWPRPTYRRD